MPILIFPLLVLTSQSYPVLYSRHYWLIASSPQKNQNWKTSKTWKGLFVKETFELSNIQSTTQEKFGLEVRTVIQTTVTLVTSQSTHSLTQMDLPKVHHTLSCFPVFKFIITFLPTHVSNYVQHVCLSSIMLSFLPDTGNTYLV